MRNHLKLNHIRNCTVIDAAVSSTDGQAAFDPAEDRSTGRLAETGSLHVRTLTLDRIILEEGFRSPSLMKIDVEGAEYDCLLGASSVIERCHPVIFLATHGQQVHNACLQFLAKWNYRLTSLDGRPVEATDELIAYPERKG